MVDSSYYFIIIGFGIIFGTIMIFAIVNWLVSKSFQIETHNKELNNNELSNKEFDAKKEAYEKAKEEYLKTINSENDPFNNKNYNNFFKYEIKEPKIPDLPKNYRLFEDIFPKDKYFVKNIELCTDKEFNYFFIYRLIGKYKLNMVQFAMPNPLILKDKGNILNPKRFIHAPETNQKFKSIMYNTVPLDKIGYIIKISDKYNINIGCVIAKLDRIDFNIKMWNKLNLETYYTKTMSHIYTEMKDFIIESQYKYIDFVNYNIQ